MISRYGSGAATTARTARSSFPHTDAYFAALGAYRNGDPVPIVERLTEATFAALANGRQLVADLQHVRADCSNA